MFYPLILDEFGDYNLIMEISAYPGKFPGIRLKQVIKKPNSWMISDSGGSTIPDLIPELVFYGMIPSKAPKMFDLSMDIST